MINIFTTAEAIYYCRTFTRTRGASAGSFKAFLASKSGSTTYFREGTGEFNEFRDSSLREIDRLLFLTATHYKKAHDLLSDSSCAWSQVTMYYGVFYAALALLAMHGAWIDFGYTKAIVYVNNGYLGSQEIVLRKDLRFINALSSLGGPHRKFWDLFYATVATLIPSLPVGRSWSLAITPVLGNRTWLIDKRNEINYDSSKSVDLIVDFQQNFKARNFRRYLPGDIKLQYEIMINIVELVFHFAKLLNVNSDALRQISPRGTRKQKILTKVFNPRMPRLLNQIRTSRIF